MSLERRQFLSNKQVSKLDAATKGEFTRLKFASMLPIIEASLEDNRRWIEDFRDDEIYVPNDLSDVISAYEHFYGQIRKS